MRNTDSILIKKAIIHVLDNNSDMPILTDYEQEIDEVIHEFLEKHIIKCLQDETNKKANFRSGNQVVLNSCEEIFDDGDTFVENSQRIAKQLFKVMKSNNNISSCDLVIALYSFEDNEYVAVLKLDYSTSFIHHVEFVEEKFKISIMPQAIGLPGLNQKIQKCAFIKRYDEDAEYDLIVLDKQMFNKEDDAGVAQFFINDFLNCNMILDSRDKTKIFKSAAEKWTRKNLREDIEKAQEVREGTISILKNAAEVDLDGFARTVLGDDRDKKDHFIQHMNNEGIEIHGFDIDKNWVEKKMKRRVMKTNTGIEIKGEYEDFEDDSKIEIKRNGDGTVNIVVKNVRFFQER
ncbi:nucleoid-associated protein [Anaeromicrobium sediminis]|uniref:Nucleoid-associated protein n=1 Tax=Anaeromicrobium sediminis TaxID=1478221 RepID=A0A267MJY7_9FIRM|nr:nucleoid-associated protein [Anaeromicrobium sediminis]PAB59195.1 hypothetical protein CCE28_11795 [Anaeromicrobium sediminis]